MDFCFPLRIRPLKFTSMASDLYSILGVPRTATNAEIKERYRFLCHAYHPDKFGSDEQRQQANGEFQRINEAYDILSDSYSRAHYDAMFQNESSTSSPPPPVSARKQFNWKKELMQFGMLVLAVFVLVLGERLYSLSRAQTIPYPTDFTKWLVGNVITVEKGIIWDDRWTIEPGEVSDLRILKLSQNPTDNIYTATVSFRATARGRGIQVNEAVIRYRDGAEPGQLTFVEFVPIAVAKIGD